MVEASAAEAVAISAALAAAKARQVNGQIEQLPDQDHDSEATPGEKQVSNLSKASDPSLPNNVTPAGVRLHHRAVSTQRRSHALTYVCHLVQMITTTGKEQNFFLGLCNLP